MTARQGAPRDAPDRLCVRGVTLPTTSPNLSFVVPGANENRWSDLLAVLLTTDPAPMAALLGVEFDTVQREVVVPGFAGREADRLDLLLLAGEQRVAAIEVKLLSDLGPRQLTRYLAAFRDAGTYRVLHLDGLPVNLRAADPWTSLTWETVLDAYAASANAWVSTTAQAWRTQLASLVPAVDGTTVWNDVPDDAAGMELALRARIAWLARRMDVWCSLEHDLVISSGGGNWAVRMWTTAATPQHFVTAEIQEGLTAYEWRPDPERPYRQRLKGPVILLGLRQDEVSSSAGFDWTLLHQLFTEHVLDDSGVPLADFVWQTSSARPGDPTDKANWQAILANGAPSWLGKGWGMKVANSTHSCLFGARLTIERTCTLAEIDAQIARLESLLLRMAAQPVDTDGTARSAR